MGEFLVVLIVRILNFVMFFVEEGCVEFWGVLIVEYFNLMGVVYGGWMVIIFDFVFGCVVMFMLKFGEGYMIVEFKVNIVCFLIVGMGEVVCEVCIFYCGCIFVIVEGYFCDSNGKLFVYGMEICVIFLIENLM